jgi:hypothetical protein
MLRPVRIAAAVLTLALAATTATADVDPRSKWVQLDNKQLGVRARHPKSATIAVHGSELAISGTGFPTVTIAIATTGDRTTGKSGGVQDLKVSWTITAPKHAATCTATADDDDQATIASQICESIEVAAAPRAPHVDLAIESTGLADGAAYEKAVRATAHQLDGCWKSALAKDHDLPEGEVEVRRTYDHGQPATTTENHHNFFDHDAKQLGACMAALIKAVPVKTASDDAATIKVNVICQEY